MLSSVDFQQLISISCRDRVFLGEALFETVRFVDGEPKYWHLHWQRLEQGAQFLGLDLTMTVDEWHEQLVLAIKQHNITHGGIKVIVTGGVADRGLTRQGRQSQLIVDVFSYQFNSKPLCLITAPWLRDAKNPVYSIKSMNYLEAILARRYAEEHHADDVLFFNTQHHALETTVANLFVLVDEALHTPALHEGILPGVMRTQIMTFCRQRGIEVCEGPINDAMLMRASSVFVCNALQGIQIVHSWDNVHYVENSSIVQLLVAELT